MYFMALAVDYDGTLAYEGKVTPETIHALVKIKESGRKLIMVTGRRLEELIQIFDSLDLFDRVVAENGALIYIPQTKAQRLLVDPPSEQFVEKLKTCGIAPLMSGKVIVATEEPHETTVLQVIRDMGLDLEIIFNKGSVMVLPSGVNKATGLAAALKELGLSIHNVIGVGDAENDHAFLRTVGLGVAVANAYESVKETAGWITKEAFGQGVEELIDQIVKNEDPLIFKVRHKVSVGTDSQGLSVELNPIDRVLIAGNSGKNDASSWITNYRGEVNIVPNGDTYNLVWLINQKQCQVGTAILNADVLSVVYHDLPSKGWGVVSYKLVEDGVLEGKWAPFNSTHCGFETLTWQKE